MLAPAGDPAPRSVRVEDVWVEGPGGATASYTLAGPDTVGRPTGIDDPDRGAARGLLPDELPETLDGIRDDGAVWSASGWLSVTGSWC